MASPPRSQARQRIRGLYVLADVEASARAWGAPDPVRLGALALEGGCRLVQLRAKVWPPGEVRAAARALAPRCRAVGATFLVNDHPDIAAEVNADGCHLGQLDMDAAQARALLGPDRILGRSTHDPSQLALAALEHDYVAFGPVWATASAGRDKGVRGLQALAALRPPVPLVAIGGIDTRRVTAVRAAGADAWAVIGAIASAEDIVAAVRALC